MKQAITCLILGALLVCCSQQAQSIQAPSQIVSAENIGKTITVEGWAVNRSLGAEVVGDNFSLWIDGLSRWPEVYYTGGDRGKKVRVTGKLDEDHGLPVFIPKEGEPPVHGIPVPPNTDLKQASHRFILKQANWVLIEE